MNNTESNKNIELIHSPTRSLCGWMTIIAGFLAILLFVFGILAVLFQDLGGVHITAAEGLTGSRRVTALILTAASLLLLSGLCLSIARLFQILGTGDVFSTRATIAVRRVGQWLMACGISYIIFPTILDALQSGGDIALTIRLGLNVDAILLILIAFTILSLGHVLYSAAKLAEENQQFI